MNFLGAVAIAASIAAFAFVQWLLHRKTLTVRWAVFGVLAVLSIPSVLCAVYYFHVLPEREWFYSMRSWAGSEFLVLFSGAAGGAFATLLPRRLTMLPLLGVVGLSVIPHVKPVIYPMDEKSFKDRWDGDSCLQSTDSTCGPASTATILKSLGVNASEQEIARAAFSSGSGTEAWYLARYVRSRGLSARFVFRRGFSPAVGIPAMVGVRVSGFGHFISVLDISDGQITYADPLSGKLRLPTTEFLRRYDFTGFHMVVTKS